MKGRKKVPKKTAATVVGLALTWDGARWPVRSLPPKARVFLKDSVAAGKAPTTERMTELLAGAGIREIRVCWVPRLLGGDDVLCAPFVTSDGLRLNFRAVEWERFADVLGVVYRELENSHR
jgi:hypothetical protein